MLFSQNRILRTQINKQNEIINNIEAFHRVFDIKKVNEFFELREKTYKDKFKIQEKSYEDRFKIIKQEFEQRMQTVMSTSNTVTSHGATVCHRKTKIDVHTVWQTD